MHRLRLMQSMHTHDCPAVTETNQRQKSTGVEGTLWRLNSTTGETVDASPLNKRVVGTPFKVVNEVWVPTEAGIVSGALQE